MSTVATPGIQPVSATSAQDNQGAQNNDGRPSPNAVPPAQTGTTRPAGRPGLRALVTVADLVVSFAAPLLAYHLIRPHVGSSASALALSGAIPVVYTLATLAIARRLNPIAVVGVISFALGVLVSWAFGGSVLALELEDPVFFGLIGLAFLGSLAAGRPLHRVVLGWLSRTSAQYKGIAERAQYKTSVIVTSIIGVTLLVHSVAVAVLALTRPVSTYNSLQNVVGLPVFAAGFVVMMTYRGRLQEQQRAAAAAAGDQSDGDQSHGTS
jgi:hypothetical protein